MKYSKYFQAQINKGVKDLTKKIDKDFLNKPLEEIKTQAQKLKANKEIKKAVKEGIDEVVKIAEQEIKKEVLKQIDDLTPKNSLFRKAFKLVTKVFFFFMSEKPKEK